MSSYGIIQAELAPTRCREGAQTVGPIRSGMQTAVRGIKRTDETMKLPENTLIAYEKLIRYLLVLKERNDKSRWLAQAGYTLENWKMLENDLRTQILSHNAVCIEETPYGQLFEINGKLTGPNGRNLSVHTIWMTETGTGQTKFITMYPDKREYKK